MEEADGETDYELSFRAAVKVIHNLPTNGSFQPSNDMMLKFYSYYKQATQGSCRTPRPGFWDPVGKAKWDAWNDLGDMPKEEAMSAYVDYLKLILESLPVTSDVEELLQVIGPFYELVDEKKKITQVSDLTSAHLERFARKLEGFGSMLTAPSRAVSRSIIRSVEMNGGVEALAPGRAAEPPEINHREQESEEVAADDVQKAFQPKERPSSPGRQNGPEAADRRKRKAQTSGKSACKNPSNQLKSEERSQCRLTDQNGHVSGENGRHTPEPSVLNVSGSHHTASDSDSEVYCDSVDQFGAQGADVNVWEEMKSTEETASQQKPREEAGEDGAAHQKQQPAVNRCDGSVLRRARGLKVTSVCPERVSAGEGRRLHQHTIIITALAGLQEDMRSVIERLHTLETLTASQAPSPAAAPAQHEKKSWWWRCDASPGTLLFALIWPFVAQWLIRQFLRRRRR